ncbi:hypothetical protein L484_010557 [Morus notabilis]|uniref:C2 domain-containing protein n=2 Tax=Morus notabilis TaxID=981085 RepID=W9SLC7_9ROSA|nr:hypothetical protein L484_010557 [Morus notabilis]
MEITVVSAEGLKTSSSALFAHRIRPFITISTVPPDPYFSTTNGDKRCHVYKTRVDDQGGTNPTWGDKFRLPIDGTAFFTNRYSGININLYTKRLFLGQSHLGSCHIPAHDIGLPPSLRHLSYRLRARDGSRTRGIINLSVRFEGLGGVAGNGLSHSVSPTLHACQTVIGVPVRPYSGVSGLPSTCREEFGVNCIGR